MATPLSSNEAAAPSPNPSSNKNPTGTSDKMTNPSQNIMSQYDQLIDFLHNLPRELFDQIQTTTLELAICPGHIFSQQRTSGQETHWNGSTHFIARPELLPLSKAIYKEYHPRYWSENTFVTGTGKAADTLSWLDKLPPTTTQHVGKFYLTFAADDSEQQWENFLARGRRRFSCRDKLADDDPSPCMGDWITKLTRISNLSPSELTFDVTQCYDMFADCWIKWLILRSMVCFEPGEAPALHVVTGDKDRHDKMLRFFLWYNEQRDEGESPIDYRLG
ncbi:MAG: hypothetical protein LQ339_005399 [Xanthoria mediterranea]|nr:MAG: hypothetical protein LQ339_005399 [Xanthoria mediterranea]